MTLHTSPELTVDSLVGIVYDTTDIIRADSGQSCRSSL